MIRRVVVTRRVIRLVVGTALLRALRLPFGLPFGREHFVVPMPSAAGLQDITSCRGGRHRGAVPTLSLPASPPLEGAIWQLPLPFPKGEG